jgi:hypothetical protein
MLEINKATFRGQYLAANAPEVLFLHIEDCAKVALLGRSPYTDQQCGWSPPDYRPVHQAA